MGLQSIREGAGRSEGYGEEGDASEDGFRAVGREGGRGAEGIRMFVDNARW